MGHKLAIFDFDDTLFNGQSHGYFISYLEEKQPLFLMLLLKLRKRVILYFYGNQNKKCKELLLSPFKGISSVDFIALCREFYESVIKNRFNESVVQELSKKNDEGYLIVVISGGFDVYLSFFQKEYRIDHLISTKLSFSNDKFLAKIDGDECLGSKKVEELNSLFKSTEVDYKNSVAYTDHITDLPLLNLVNRKVVVYKNEKPKWVTPEMEFLKIK